MMPGDMQNATLAGSVA